MNARSRAAAAASLLGAVWGCGANSEPRAALIAVSPPMAFNDAPSSLLIEGGPFRPAYRFDTMAGAAKTEVSAFSARLTPVPGAAGAGTLEISLDPVAWISVGALAATLPAGVPAGIYDVDVTDPRGQHTVLTGAFQSLGPDHQDPIVTILTPHPGSLVGAQTTVTVTLMADDGMGLLESLTATVSALGTTLYDGPCTVPPASQTALCYFEFAAPTPVSDQDVVMIDAQAADSVHNPGYAHGSFKLAPRPTLISLAPTVGPAAGGTLIDIRGADFVVPLSPFEGSQVLIGDIPLLPEMVNVMSSTQITATTPSHDFGYATVRVSTGGATTAPISFEFVSTPIVRMVIPGRGPISGGTKISVVGNNFRDGGTTIRIGTHDLPESTFVSAQRIDGVLPPGTDTGAVDVIADDLISGTGMLADGFTYDPITADPPDGGIGPVGFGGTP